MVKQVAREAVADNITGESAKVAYYLFLSLFPLLLLLFSLTGFLGGEAAFEWIMSRIGGAGPVESRAVLENAVREITESRDAGALSVGLVLTLWAASGGFAALADGLNTMYDIDESRSWWRKRLVAIGILMAAAVLLVGGALLILAGPAIGRSLGFGSVWDVLRWPLAFVLLVLLAWLVYYFLPNRDQEHAKRETLAGAAAAAALWLVATLLFRLYVANFGSYTATYGFIGAVIVLMLWLYLTSAALLLGGEVAAILEARQSPGGSPAAARPSGKDLKPERAA